MSDHYGPLARIVELEQLLDGAWRSSEDWFKKYVTADHERKKLREFIEQTICQCDEPLSGWPVSARALLAKLEDKVGAT